MIGKYRDLPEHGKSGFKAGVRAVKIKKHFFMLFCQLMVLNIMLDSMKQLSVAVEYVDNHVGGFMRDENFIIVIKKLFVTGKVVELVFAGLMVTDETVDLFYFFMLGIVQINCKIPYVGFGVVEELHTREFVADRPDKKSEWSYFFFFDILSVPGKIGNFPIFRGVLNGLSNSGST